MKRFLAASALACAANASPAATTVLPPLIHFCALNCVTLQLRGENQYVVLTRYSWQPPDYQSVWTVKRFTPELVEIHRHDWTSIPAPRSLDLDYQAQISPDGNALVDITTNGKSVPPARMTWGTALGMTPGDNAERDRNAADAAAAATVAAAMPALPPRVAIAPQADADVPAPATKRRVRSTSGVTGVPKWMKSCMELAGISGCLVWVFDGDRGLGVSSRGHQVVELTVSSFTKDSVVISMTDRKTVEATFTGKLSGGGIAGTLQTKQGSQLLTGKWTATFLQDVPFAQAPITMVGAVDGYAAPCDTSDPRWRDPAGAFDKAIAAIDSGDVATGVCWSYVAAMLGDSKAQTSYGYDLTVGRGVAKDPTQAFMWTQLAALQGESTAEANLVGMYEHGRGVEQDYDKTDYWVEQHARSDDVIRNGGALKQLVTTWVLGTHFDNAVQCAADPDYARHKGLDCNAERAALDADDEARLDAQAASERAAECHQVAIDHPYRACH